MREDLPGVGVAGDRPPRGWPRVGASPVWSRVRAPWPGSRDAGGPCAGGCGAGRARSWSLRGRVSRCPGRRPRDLRPDGTWTRPIRAGAAGGTRAGASSTWALPSRDLACWAKMSRMRAVRSTTLTPTTSSSARRWEGGELAIDDDRVGAHSGHHLSELPGLAGPEVCCGVGGGRASE